MAHGWADSTPAAVVCAASTKNEWVWTGRLGEMEHAEPPEGLAGVLVVGEVVGVRQQILRVMPEDTTDVPGLPAEAGRRG
jgi:siroheme synthase